MTNLVAALCAVLYVLGIVTFCWLLIGGPR
jgi:hypothetical protein